VLLVLIGAGIGYASTLLVTTEYAARAQILYPLTEESPTGFLREDRSLTTQLVLLRSRTVLAPAAQANGLSVQELDDKLRASVVEGSEVVDLEVRDPDREVGLRLADAVTARYLAVANDVPSENRAYLRSELAEVERRLDAGELSPGQTAALAGRRATLLDRLDALELAGPQATLLTPAYSADDPVSPRPLLAGAAGALSGLLVAAALVFLLARRWTRR
jgi:capsular polysaccharide biosynthesis protein